MGYEVTRRLPLTKHTIRTPMQKMEAPVLDGPLPVVVPILRAGLGMAEGLVELIPDCQIGHIGLYRDEKKRTGRSVCRPPARAGKQCLCHHRPHAGHRPFRGTYAFDLLVRHGVKPKNIILMCLVAAPEGVRCWNSVTAMCQSLLPRSMKNSTKAPIFCPVWAMRAIVCSVPTNPPFLTVCA